MKARSLRFRLIAAAAVWVVVGFVAAFFALSAIFRDHVTQQFFEELFVHVDELERLTVEDPNGNVRLRSVFSDPRYEIPASGYYWEVRDNDQVRLRSASLQSETIGKIEEIGEIEHPHPLPRHMRLRTDGPTGRLLLTELEDTQPDGLVRSFIVGTDARHLESLVREFNQTLIAALAILGATMIAAAGAIAAFGLAPFSGLAASLRSVRAGKTEFIKGEQPAEVAPLVDELNALIASGRKSVEAARAQAGALAHGLKTPLAIVTSEAYELDGRGEHESATTIIEQCRNMQQQVDHHIARARASAMALLPGLRSDVCAVARQVIPALSRIHRNANVTIEMEIAEGITAAIDPQDLSEILGNLIDNAFKHARSRIVVAAALKNGKTCITVDDDGPGIPVEGRTFVLKQGARLSPETPGSGLGLSIVSDLVGLFGGELRLDEAELGGLRVEICIRNPETSPTTNA
ncbi:MAG: sensor histidine kinase [Hyphomonadaceae bacterium]